MSVYQEIINSFKEDEPIFIEEIESLYSDKSRPWIDKTIKTMVDQSLIKRFSTGIYYIPRKTMFGEAVLSTNKVIQKKYLSNKEEVYGYASGISLLNSIGLTTQVPNKITIVTNKESSRGRTTMVGKQELYLMRSPTRITKDNYAVLQLLEIVKFIDLEELDDLGNDNLINYIKENAITVKDISKYCRYFPDYVSKRILGGNLIDVLTQQ